jgi:cysteinyl-tRNA synthetase
MGGIDLVFPHHQNEIAQSEAFTGKQFSKYWMHCGHLLVEGKKMAKSANNFHTLRDICAKYPDISPKLVARALRLMVLTTNYRENFNFTFSTLEAGLKTLESFDAILDRIRNAPKSEGKVRKDVREFAQMAMLDFVEYLEDDLNTPEALARVHECINDMNRVMDSTELFTGEIHAITELLKSFDSVLGLFDFSRLTEVELPEEIRNLVERRDSAKASKDFALADVVRSELEAAGYAVTDTKGGTKVQKKQG